VRSVRDEHLGRPELEEGRPDAVHVHVEHIAVDLGLHHLSVVGKFDERLDRCEERTPTHVPPALHLPCYQHLLEHAPAEKTGLVHELRVLAGDNRAQ